MSNKEAVEKPSGSVFGREFIIVLVIIFSGLSFTLGYFVGKKGDPGADYAGRPAEPPLQPRKPDLQPDPPQLTAAQQPEQQPQLPAAPHEPAPSAQPAVAAAPPAPAAVVPEKPAPPKKTEQAAAEPAPSKSGKAVEAPPQKEEAAVLYTVQIGAFKSSADAKHLKAKFAKKGYKPYISTAKNRKSQKIYKVKTGEFADRKEAEVLALKLKKTEGLQTYVTVKTE